MFKTNKPKQPNWDDKIRPMIFIFFRDRPPAARPARPPGGQRQTCAERSGGEVVEVGGREEGARCHVLSP